MRGMLCIHVIFGFILIVTISPCLSAEPNVPTDESKYLQAVREFADNVLKYGRDTYGPKHTPLFVDGLNIHTHEPVKWIDPDGTKWIISNFASQQTLMRTLDGLTTITGDPKYRQAAMDAIHYAFENLRTPNGLFYWGDMIAYDAQADEIYPRSDGIHSFKSIYPHYELMWKVNPDVTRDFIECLWAAHVKDWSNLDMDRGVGLDRLNVPKDWKQEYTGGPIYFKSNSIPFCSTGMNLCYAAAVLSKFTGLREPLTWSKRLAHRYVETRDPRTGFSDYTYTQRTSPNPLAEDFASHVIWPLNHDFGGGDLSCRDPFIHIYILSPGLIGNYGCITSISELLFSHMLGVDGREFQQWALEELTARGKVLYHREDNSWMPMLADGTNLEGYVCKEDMYFSQKGTTIQAWQTDSTDFWAYALAYRTTGNEFMWTMAKDIARGNQLGDIGEDPTGNISLNINTKCANAHALLAFLYLYDSTRKRLFLYMAQKIGDNILAQKFYRGFFVPSNRHTYTKFDAVEALVLLHLYALLKPECPRPPQVWPSNARFMAPYRQKGGVVFDVSVIYTLTEFTEPPLSINEAAAMGKTELVKSLLADGTNADNVEHDAFITPLHRAAQNGHEEIVKLLLAAGANLDAQDSWPGAMPLHYAAEGGHTETVEVLITNGADLDAKITGYPKGYTPLHSAIRAGHKDAVALLVAQGADVNAKDKTGCTPLDLAARISRRPRFRADQKDIEEILTKAVEAQTTEKKSSSPQGPAKEPQKNEHSFEMAILTSNLEAVRELISQGADVNVRDSRGNTPLVQAIMLRTLSRIDRLSLIKMLISAGADVNAKNKMTGGTSLHAAAWRGDRDLVELLVTNDADVSTKNGRGLTPLEVAQRRGNAEIVEIFRQVEKEQTLVHDVAITKVSATPSCVQGETVSIVVTLENQGDCSESSAIKMMDTANGREIARQSTTILSKHWAASEADLIITGEVEDETEFGNWCNAEGDVNGDGFNDLLITAHHYPSMSVSRGRAYLYYGGPQMDNTPDKRFTGEESGDTFGGNAGFLVDMNNDGLADVILGARHHGGRGRVYVFYGGTDMDEKPDIILDPPACDGTDLSFGRGGMHPGDFNGDGIMDLACSAVRYNAYMGRVYLYYGPLASDTTVDKVFTGEATDDTFGAIMGVGDVNGDKCDDLLIATRYYPANTGVGRAYLYYGSPGTSMDTTCDVLFEPPDEGKNEFGSSADVFDVDHDGFADVLIGARRWPNGKSTGRAYVYWGKPDGFDNTVGLTVTGEDASSALGGDFINCRYANDDPFGDILVTAYDYNRQQSRAYLYYGSKQEDMDAAADCIFTPEPGRNGVFRSALADLNNDGHGDVVMAGAYYNNLQGRAWLWYGPFSNASDITFNWDTTNASIGKHTLKVEIPPVPGEQNTEDNIKTMTIEVKEPRR